MRAERRVRETMLAQIVAHGRRGAAKPRADSTARRYASPGISFRRWWPWRSSPFVVLGDLGTAAAAVVCAGRTPSSVLIIACPCALGSGDADVDRRGGRQGGDRRRARQIAEALERLEKVDTLVVDKTGTLTEGKPRVVAVIALRRAYREDERAALCGRAGTVAASIRWRGAVVPRRASADGDARRTRPISRR